MTINHIYQLAEWWEAAEEGEAAPGDWIITHGTDDTNPAYIVEQAPRYPLSRKRQPYRILARAPKPKPAWHDAVAVIAHTKGWGRRRVFTRYEGASTNGNRIWSCGNLNYGSDDLIAPAPLIEAKVTDEMVKRAIDRAEDLGYIERVFGEIDGIDQGAMAEIVAAALGLEAE